MRTSKLGIPFSDGISNPFLFVYKDVLFLDFIVPLININYFIALLSCLTEFVSSFTTVAAICRLEFLFNPHKHLTYDGQLSMIIIAPNFLGISHSHKSRMID